MEFVIGIDESGTGAWAGPFTVVAYGVPGEELAALRRCGAADSKAHTDKTRREVCLELAARPRYVAAVAVVPTAKTMPQKLAWRAAVLYVARRALAQAQAADGPRGNTEQDYVHVDGCRDGVVAAAMSGAQVRFLVGGDALCPAVGAASMLAKTIRNDHMLQFARQYPQYRFAKNYGYGTKAHLAAIEEHGICAEHRKIQRLEKYFL